MADQPPRSLNHFSTFQFTDAYWNKDKAFRQSLHADWLQSVRGLASSVHHYQTFGLERTSDFLMWCAVPADDARGAEVFFSAYANAMGPFRPFMKMRDALWGLTRRSQYSRARSAGEIDPFQSERTHPYLIIYPFTKTADWYLQSQETRQSMMNEHISIGKQYRDITQLLLYSFGLQDQEFVVVYETDDLSRFSDLVQELRRTEGRRFTKNDTPLHTAIYQPNDNALPAW